MQKTEIKFRCISNYITAARRRPFDGFAFTFLVVVSILTYFNGTFVILPQLLVGLPAIILFGASIVTTWIITAILSNLFLIRYRDSSIVNRMLIHPTVKTSYSSSQQPTTPDDIIKEQTKSMGQHFMPKPFGEEGNWHICATCEVFVPPRAWHCIQCKTCVLRRDHHCIFAMSCVGEENHSNFLGLVLYLAIGSSLATGVNIIYTLLLTTTPFWLFVIKAFIPFYTMIFDFSFINLLSATNFLGMGISWLVFVNYMMMAFRNQTCADNKRGSNPSVSRYAYTNAVNFLGSNILYRLFWPFHSPLKNSYGPTDVPETRKGQ